MERAFTVNLGGDPARAGIYKIGAWYDTSKSADLVRDVHGGDAALSGEPDAQQHRRWAAMSPLFNGLLPPLLTGAVGSA